jgi:hypothetical protein
MRRSLPVLFASFAALIAVPAAASGPGMFVGAAEDALKWHAPQTMAVARDLGLGAIAISLDWPAGQTDLTPVDADYMTRAVVGAGGMRIVLAIHNYGGAWAPNTELEREHYCGYARRVLTRFPQINDIVVWNEPNLSSFWRPQFTPTGESESPARYEELLAHCWDVLHDLRPGVNVVGLVTSLWGNDNPNAFSNVSHSPARFIRAVGAAYRASGRTRPLFDTIGHHPYPARTDERPWTRHSDEAIVSIGDGDRLLSAVHDAFAGTPQPLPENGVPIWYLETGYQTLISPAKQSLYDGAENWPAPIPDLATSPVPLPPDGPAPDQATQLVDSVRMTYCQPYIAAIFNFHLVDEATLTGWQSGVLWADGSRKGSYDAYRSVIHDVNEGRVDCNAVAAVVRAAGGTSPRQPGPATPASQRSITKVTYQGPRRVPYGMFRLRARLTRGVTTSNRGLAGRQVVFVIGGAAYLTMTNAQGFAAIRPMPPTRPGRHPIAIRFRGDELDLASGQSIAVRIVNSRARIETRGSLRLARTLDATLAARSKGGSVTGTLVLRERARTRTVKLTAVGLRADGRAAWLAGLERRRDRYVVHLEWLLPARRVRVRIWRNDVPLQPSVTVPAAQLHIARR